MAIEARSTSWMDRVAPGWAMGTRTRRALRTAGVLGLFCLLPGTAWSSPTPPPPAPQVKLGEVKVIEETRGTRTVVDAAGRRHYLMRRVTPADRQAAAVRARSMREATLRRQFGAVNAGKAEVNKEGTK